jgi:glycosyltransferase involved in cell wall biosynthesis
MESLSYNKMKFSFIIPMFNEEKTIALCIDAIISEMHEDDEIIVIDNGSTDNSIKIVKRYEMVRLLEKPGITIGALRNTGTVEAMGDILAFIDADCVICRGWRDYVCNSFENPSVAACGSKYELPVNACWIEKAWFSQRKYSAGAVNYINSGNLVVKKKVFKEIGGFDKNLITGEDAELCWRLNLKGFTVWENPDIKAIHLGNPKNLWNFYKKQRWHGIGMFGTFKLSWADKPVIMTFFFILSLLLWIIWISNFANVQGSGSPLVVTLVSVLLVPVVTSIYRCFQYKKISCFLQLVVLYLFYFVARVDALLQICFKSILKKSCFSNRR